jgi:hypothetical protein
MNKSNGISEKEQVWRGHLARAAKFSGSASAFCRSESLSIPAFQYWKQKLNPKNKNTAPALPAFVRVQVEESVSHTRAEVQLPDPRWVAEIILQLYRSCR